MIKKKKKSDLYWAYLFREDFNSIDWPTPDWLRSMLNEESYKWHCKYLWTSWSWHKVKCSHFRHFTLKCTCCTPVTVCYSRMCASLMSCGCWVIIAFHIDCHSMFPTSGTPLCTAGIFTHFIKPSDLCKAFVAPENSWIMHGGINKSLLEFQYQLCDYIKSWLAVQLVKLSSP